MTEAGKRIRSYIVENFLFGDDSRLGESTSFLEEGIIDSTGVLELVDFLEKEFKLKIPDAELIPENLDSLANIEKYLRRKLTNAHPPVDSPAAMSAGA